MRISVVSDGINWAVDAIKNDYCKNTRHEISNDADLSWIVSWQALSHNAGKKNIVGHLHHVDRARVSGYNFGLINSCKACIVPNKITESFIQKIVNVPVKRLPYWVLSNFTHPVQDRSRIEKIRGDGSKIIIGSFQKDTETLTQLPKLVKGPDTFVNIIKKINKIHPVKVVLSGFERGFVISKLMELGVEYEYYERDGDISDLYESLDWYFITSRDEGGPQSALEAAYKNVNLLSTNVGICPEILHNDCICETEDDFVSKSLSGLNRRAQNFSSIQKYKADVLIPQYDDFFEGLVH